jgi:hypothetical protein
VITFACCTTCGRDDCPQPVCLDDDPRALMDCCGEIACEEHQGEGHVCELAEVPC